MIVDSSWRIEIGDGRRRYIQCWTVIVSGGGELRFVIGKGTTSNVGKVIVGAGWRIENRDRGERRGHLWNGRR